MSGKLPIDRVREAEDAPRIYEEHKQRLAEQEAKLPGEAASPPQDAARRGEQTGAENGDA